MSVRQTVARGDQKAEPVVAASRLSVAFGGRIVLRGLDIVVGSGEIVALLGVNGSGKSTLLRCLCGLVLPDFGTVTVLGGKPTGSGEFWRDVGLAAEEPAWFGGLTVREHLELVRLTHRLRDGTREAVAAMLDRFGLAGHADATPLTLSAGQRQRLALASLLIRPSRLLLLDEPEQKLDREFRARLGGVLRDYVDTGGTIVMATHDESLAADVNARLLAMNGGRLVPAAIGMETAE